MRHRATVIENATMSLPHHRRRPIFTRLAARVRCIFRGHAWRPFDLYSCECAWCGKLRRMPLRDPSPIFGVLDTKHEKPTATTSRMMRESEDLALVLVKQWNDGARLADDHFCQLCGKRGVRGRYCESCSEVQSQ